VMVLAIGHGPRGQLVSVGAACNVDPVRALRKAALEASQDRVYVRLLIEREPGWAPAADFGNVTDFSLHARVYSGRPALWDKGSAFLRGTEAGPLPAQRDGSPKEAFARAGVSAVAVDLTPAWASSLGLAVARVVAKDLVPLHGSHAFRYLGHPRLARGTLAMPGSMVNHDLASWPYPHPMP
jgi:ribosomal protein S12 methylthiotransferase accessory factor YcaO